MGMIADFKEFAMGGSLIDMATGIIVGVASGKLISSLVENVIMPPIGVALGGTDFSSLGTELQAATGDVPAVMLKWGAFIQSFIDFLIIMLVVFIIVKIATRNKVEEEDAPSQEDLLTDIRDLLKK
ncbi:MAG: large-conductance mechanosensitive channel protein MscL [Thiotrichaceae bacterium]